VNELSQQLHLLLEASPLNKKRRDVGLSVANCILLRGCGSCIDVPSFQQFHGLRPFMIAPTCIIAGLGMNLKFDIVQAPGATGDYHTNLESKFRTALQTITDSTLGYQFGFIHIKAVDDAGHDKNVSLKLKFLEEIDRCLGILMQGLQDDERKGSAQVRGVLLVWRLTNPWCFFLLYVFSTLSASRETTPPLFCMATTVLRRFLLRSARLAPSQTTREGTPKMAV